jgi:hypothetical protein
MVMFLAPLDFINWRMSPTGAAYGARSVAQRNGSITEAFRKPQLFCYSFIPV